MIQPERRSSASMSEAKINIAKSPIPTTKTPPLVSRLAVWIESGYARLDRNPRESDLPSATISLIGRRYRKFHELWVVAQFAKASTTEVIKVYQGKTLK